ncbi:MAG: hypothetical protein RL336_592 [Pseudomonadota bacterium]|jgi:glutathione S-transferase
MHLYTYDPAPNPKRISYVLQYKGIDIPTTQIDLAKLEQFSDEFKAVNERCSVPALKLEDGRVLCSVLAIAQYLDSMYPEHPIFGRDAIERAEVTDWTHRLFIDGYVPIQDMLRNRSKHFENRAVVGRINVPQIPDLIARGKLRLDDFWQVMDEHLADREFIVTDIPTMADIDLYCLCEFAGWVKEHVPENASHLQRWIQRFKEVLGGVSR